MRFRGFLMLALGGWLTVAGLAAPSSGGSHASGPSTHPVSGYYYGAGYGGGGEAPAEGDTGYQNRSSEPNPSAPPGYDLALPTSSQLHRPSPAGEWSPPLSPPARAHQVVGRILQVAGQRLTLRTASGPYTIWASGVPDPHAGDLVVAWIDDNNRCQSLWLVPRQHQ
ncbi:MAG TPA: hypothetical protein VGO93_14085 [Candidatus Xenobia bacterium]